MKALIQRPRGAGFNSAKPTIFYRTLSTAEWQYLFNYSSYANATRAGLYAYGVTVVGKTNCVVLYPDGFTGTKVSNGDTTSYDTAEKWAAAQNAGVVCLPAAGYRDDDDFNVDHINSQGYYWYSSAKGNNRALYVYFHSSGVDSKILSLRKWGYSVRLVTEVK